MRCWAIAVQCRPSNLGNVRFSGLQIWNHGSQVVAGRTGGWAMSDQKAPSDNDFNDDPFNVEIERALLSSLMAGPDECIEPVSGTVPPEAFYYQENRNLYIAIAEVYGSGTIDLVLVHEPPQTSPREVPGQPVPSGSAAHKRSSRPQPVDAAFVHLRVWPS